MRYLVYSDLQATEGSERRFSDPSQSLQRYRVELFYKQLKRISVKYKCNGLLDLGDTTDDRSSIPIPTLDAVLSGLEPFQQESNYKLVGNHEQYQKDGSIHAGKVFSSAFIVVPEIRSEDLGNCILMMVSFHANEGELAAKIKAEFESNRSRKLPIIVLGHFPVVGCAMNSGLSLSGVTPALLAPAKMVILGHIHKPQTLRGTQIHFVGSPFQQNFGEAGESKRVGILDTDTLKLEWVPITGMPEYRVVRLNDFVQSADSKTEDRFRVILHSPAEAEKFFAHPLSGRAEAIYSYEISESGSHTSTMSQTMTMDDALRRWVSESPPEKRGIDLESAEMLEFGRQIAREG